MKKLIPLSDFVFEQKRKTTSETDYVKPLKLIFNYAEFLKQPLTLAMFVPCDEEGNIIEIQPYFTFADPEYKNKPECIKYWQAKEKLLFVRGPKLNEGKFRYIVEKYKDIEGLANNGWELELTPSALEAIGIK
ncbi:hypothetical protein [Chryseobacterium sp. 2VB]|uniref:hypothetical protein n=1 Tax=Chryseobacterium sp. 2VB TaxID=2502204 RepID=UPI0010F802B2|nr:hypothetical protein [Chryseobacterium sp. 2VB]